MTEHEMVSYLRDLYDDYSRRCDGCDLLTVNTWHLSEEVGNVISKLHPEVMKRYYGTGMVIPDDIEGLSVLDIGCGSGSLTFTLSKLIGPKGRIVGIDLSPYQIYVCKKYEDYHRWKWGFEHKNTEFHVANAEKLPQFKDNSFDVIVSNGVMSLPPDRKKAFGEAFRLLKEHGEFYFSETYTNKAPPSNLMSDKSLWESGITSSFIMEDLVTTVKTEGFTSPYLTGASKVAKCEEYQENTDLGEYCSANTRMFRLQTKVEGGSAYVTYKGPGDEFKWDVNHTFKRGDTVCVNRELAAILTNTRYKNRFEVTDCDESPSINLVTDPFEYIARVEKDSPVHYTYTLK